jgi:hypothetical protein
MANKLDIKLNLPSDAELKRMFDMVPKLDQYKVGDQVVTAGTQPIVKRARELAPRGNKADRAKRSKKQRDKADWEYPLWKTIKRVIRKYQRYTNGVVGPEWPKGNKAYFNTSPNGRRVFLWGKATGKVAVQVRNWIVQAFDETKPQQLAAMKAKLTTLIDKLMRNG